MIVREESLRIGRANKLIHERWRQALDDNDLEGASFLFASAMKLNKGAMIRQASPWFRDGITDREEMMAITVLAFCEAWNDWDPEKGPLWSWSRLRVRRALTKHIGQQMGLSRYEMEERWELNTRRKHDLPFDEGRLQMLGSARQVLIDVRPDEEGQTGIDTLQQVASAQVIDWVGFVRERDERAAILWAFDTLSAAAGSKAASTVLAKIGLIDPSWRLRVGDTDLERHVWHRATQKATAVSNHPAFVSAFAKIASGEMTDPPPPPPPTYVEKRTPLLNLPTGKEQEIREEIVANG